MRRQRTTAIHPKRAFRPVRKIKIFATEKSLTFGCVKRRPRPTPTGLEKSIGYRADRRRDPTPIHNLHGAGALETHAEADDRPIFKHVVSVAISPCSLDVIHIERPETYYP
ncbi:hypothetical protein SAMN05444161_9117 [Rhizobiales bacterium GAS191]|nr:hypothetical protein SAMN05444161_9117 [Rhizobiales bacterium GAS191]